MSATFELADWQTTTDLRSKQLTEHSINHSRADPEILIGGGRIEAPKAPRVGVWGEGVWGSAPSPEKKFWILHLE